MTTTETRMIAADLRNRGFRVGTPSAAGVNVGLRHRRPGRSEIVNALDACGYDPAEITNTTLREQITGTYDGENLAELTHPVAWSGTVDAETRREQEADRAELVDEIRDALADPDVAAVRVERGEIVDYCHRDHDWVEADIAAFDVATKYATRNVEGDCWVYTDEDGEIGYARDGSVYLNRLHPSYDAAA